MEEQDYITQRIDGQIEWLSARSGWNQRRFERLRLAEIVLGSSIPVAVVLPLPDAVGKPIVAAAGAAIAIIAGAISLWRFQELWVAYRATAEALKREKMRYLTAAAPYDEAGRFGLLVARVEALLAEEHAGWVGAGQAQPARREEDAPPPA